MQGYRERLSIDASQLDSCRVDIRCSGAKPPKWLMERTKQTLQAVGPVRRVERPSRCDNAAGDTILIVRLKRYGTEIVDLIDTALTVMSKQIDKTLHNSDAKLRALELRANRRATLAPPTAEELAKGNRWVAHLFHPPLGADELRELVQA